MLRQSLHLELQPDIHEGPQLLVADVDLSVVDEPEDLLESRELDTTEMDQRMTVRIVKEEIQQRIDNYIISTLWKFEQDLMVRAQSICQNFEEIAGNYDKVLETAEDVVEMETYKSNLQLDMTVL